MPTFIFAYHSRGGARPKDGAQHMARWRAWMSGMGDAVVDRGKPVSRSKMVSADGVSDDVGPYPFGGYTVVRAASLDDAVKMAKGSPHLDIGTIEVAEAMDMEM
jgi:hypothetical protein